MRLTTFTDYTVRVLIYLGIYPDQITTAGELAQHYDISRNHLNKVVHYLGQKGLVETIRGKGGGLRLAVPVADINIGLLLRDTERNSALVECFNAGDCGCKILPACRFTGILREAQASFFGVLDRYTLADLVADREQLQALFG